MEGPQIMTAGGLKFSEGTGRPGVGLLPASPQTHSIGTLLSASCSLTWGVLGRGSE